MDYLGDMLLRTVMIGTLILQVWAAVDAIIRPTPAFVAAGKLTKPAWLVLTLGSLVVGVFFQLLSVFGIAALVASIVYLVDVRPAVREVRRGGH